MSKKERETNAERVKDLKREDGIPEELPRPGVVEDSDIEQARLENRREADLDDKTPSGDGGVEDNNPKINLGHESGY